MSGQDVRQLLLQVDASVALAQRNLSTLRNQVDSDTKAMETSLDRPAAASDRLGEATGRLAERSGNARVAQMELMHVVRSSTDSFAAGQSVATIFAMEIGRVAEASTFMGGSLGKVGEYMSGPWGLIITGGISVLTALIAGHHGAAASAHEHETAEETLVRAMAGEEDAIQKVTDAIRAQREQSDQALQTDTRRIAMIYGHVQAQLELAQATRQTLKAQLETELHSQQVLAGAMSAPSAEGAGATSAGYQNAQAQIADIQRQIAAQDVIINNAPAIMAAQATQLARAMATAQGRFGVISDVHQEHVERPFLTRYAAATTDREREAILGEMTRAEAALSATRDAGRRAIDDSEAAERRRNSTIQTGRQVSLQEASSIARSIGGRITSQTRSYSEQAHLYAEYQAGRGPLAAAPGTSAHERGTAIDIAGVSIGQVREAFRAAGVHLRQLLLETNPRNGAQHVHADFGSGSRGPSAETLAHRQAAAQARQVHQDDQFDTELSQANERLLQAKRALAGTTENQVGFAIEQARIDGQQRDAGYQHQLNEHRLTAAEAKRLTALNDAATEAQVAAIQQREDRRLAEEAARMQSALLDSERGMLEGQLQLAGTDRERLAIARRILAIEEQQERNQITNTLRPGSGASPDDISRALAQYQNIDQRYTNRGAALDQQYEGPAERRLRALRGEVGDLNTAFEGLGVQAMDRLAEATTNEIKNLLHLHGALGDIIGDFIQLALHRGEMSLLDSLMGGGKGGGGGFLSSLSHLFGGGGNGGGGAAAGGGIDPIIGFATGGSIFVGGNAGVDRNLLSLNGQPVARVSRGEQINVVPQMPRVRIPQAANSNGNVHLHVTLDDRLGLQAKFVGISAGVTATMAPATAAAGAGMALRKASQSASRRIPTGF